MKTASWMGLILIMIFNTMALGQKGDDKAGPVGIFESRAQYNRFMGSAKNAAFGEGGNAELRAMIPMLNDIALNRPVGWSANQFGANGGTFNLISNEAVRRDIEMVDSQYRELQDLNSQIQKRASEKILQLDFNDRENLVSQIQQIREQASDDLNSVLLPHQLDRLKQIRMQSLLQRQGLVDVLTSEPVKTDLEISQRQSVELKEFESVVQADLAKEISQLQEKARNRLLAKLTPAQEKQAKEMIGEAFAFKPKEKETGKNSRKPSRKRK